jgi:hypothetical protein
LGASIGLKPHMASGFLLNGNGGKRRHTSDEQRELSWH